MKYSIFYRGKPLSYFHPNGNGSRTDIIGFSWKSYSFFDSYERAQVHFNYIVRSVDANFKRYGSELYSKLINTLEHCIIEAQ
jgi:hypothetical protein